jgi:two-component system CheB/CheR fusion protein
LVQRFTQVKVVVAEDGEQVQTGHVYIIPPNRDLSIHQGKLRLTRLNSPHGLRLPIDFFLRSLALDQGELSVGIILSGTGTDGTSGLKSIKEAGGLVMVQAPETADYDGMPRSALSTHLADYVLTPDQMPERLLQYVQRAARPGLTSVLSEKEQVEDSLEGILHLLQAKTGHDFSAYKNSMLSRRIERRMAVHLIAALKDYQAFLEQNPAEIEALFNDLLIGVTSFFRNPEAFELLKEKVIPSILKDRPDRDVVRVWVPACSTGEEAYSLAILFRECLEQQAQDMKIQIFATDIDAQAIAKARAGVYPENIALDLPVDRLDRFFLHEDNSYSIRKNIREMVVFAEHNLIDNPPFSKLDLISCRNLLI